MVTPEVIAFIQDQMVLGKPKEQIVAALRIGGEWPDEDIAQAMEYVMHAKPIKRHTSARFFIGIIAALIVLGGVVYMVMSRYVMPQWLRKQDVELDTGAPVPREPFIPGGPVETLQQ